MRAFLLMGALGAVMATTEVRAEVKNPTILTPTGLKLLQTAEKWKKGQWIERENYATPYGCAKNLSRVFRDAGLPQYQAQSVYGFLAKARARGGLVVSLPRNNAAGIRNAITRLFGGRIPVGTLVAGCEKPGCSQGGPKEHIGFAGLSDDEHNVWVWHNNWLRRGDRTEYYGHFIVSERNLSKDFPREWMRTPWLHVGRDERGVTDTHSLLPEIDDLDPDQYYVTLVVLPEIVREVRAGSEIAFTPEAPSVREPKPEGQEVQPAGGDDGPTFVQPEPAAGDEAPAVLENPEAEGVIN